MHRTTIVVLQVLIAGLLALLLFCQVVVLPSTANSMAARTPEFAQLRVPGIVIGVVFALCAQVLLVCVWRLLSLVRVGAIFSDRSFVWVDVALGAVVVATLLVVGSLVILQIAGASPRRSACCASWASSWAPASRC